MNCVNRKMHCRAEIDSIVENFKKAVGIKHNKEAAQLLGISDKDFSNRKRTGTLFRVILEWIANQGLDLNKIVYNARPSDAEHDASPQKTEYCSSIKPARDFIQIEGDSRHLLFSREWITKIAADQKNALLITMTGNSMEPSLCDGDAAMIDRSRTAIHEGSLFAIRLDGTVMIKRLSLRPGDRVRVISDNREYDSYDTAKQDIEIVGQVIWIARQLVS